MPKNLTRAAEDSAAWFIELNHGALTKATAEGAKPGKLWRVHYELAVCLYAEDAPASDVREHFVEAARYGVAAYERVPPPDAKKIRTPRDFRLLLGVVAGFGSDDERRRAAGVERCKWLHPETPEYALLADTLEQLQAFLGGRFDAGRAREVIERLGAENVEREGVRFLAPLVTALVAVEKNDADGVNRALQVMVDEHKHQALFGEYQLSLDGLVAVVPLGIARLARERGLPIDVGSPYLPLALLD